MNQLTKNSTIMAFDYGTVNIGVAVGQFTTCTATPLPYIKYANNKFKWEVITKLIADWKPQAVVIGLPYNMDGSLSEIAILAKKFANKINGRFNIPAFLSDERLTTHEAKLIRKNNDNTKKSKRQKPIDSVAAVLILESWLLANKNKTENI
jgi:putative Holliday junction resolvase